MAETLLAAAFAFVGTDLDDLALNLLLFAQAETGKQRRAVIAGKYLGTGTLVLLSLLAAYGLRPVPRTWLGWLGLAPIALGLRNWAAFRREQKQPGQPGRENRQERARSLTVQSALVTVANGADNLGVYIPLFAGYTPSQMAAAAVVFGVMTGLWCVLSIRLTELPPLRRFLQAYRHILVPAVLVLLGFYIMARGFLAG